MDVQCLTPSLVNKETKGKDRGFGFVGRTLILKYLRLLRFTEGQVVEWVTFLGVMVRVSSTTRLSRPSTYNCFLSDEILCLVR